MVWPASGKPRIISYGFVAKFAFFVTKDIVLVAFQNFFWTPKVLSFWMRTHLSISNPFVAPRNLIQVKISAFVTDFFFFHWNNVAILLIFNFSRMPILVNFSTSHYTSNSTAPIHRNFVKISQRTAQNRLGRTFRNFSLDLNDIEKVFLDAFFCCLFSFWKWINSGKRRTRDRDENRWEKRRSRGNCVVEISTSSSLFRVWTGWMDCGQGRVVGKVFDRTTRGIVLLVAPMQPDCKKQKKSNTVDYNCEFLWIG